MTNKMLKESEKVRKLQYRPYVIADMQLNGLYLKMIVKNVGNDSASNVNIIVDELSDNPLSKIDFLAPGRELSNFLGYIRRENDDDTDGLLYHFHVNYKDSSGGTYNTQYLIDLTTFLNLTNYRHTENKDIVDKLDKIVDRIKDTNTEIHRMSDSIKTGSDAMKDIKNKLR